MTARRPICAECRLIPTLDTVLMGKLLLEQVEETLCDWCGKGDV